MCALQNNLHKRCIVGLLVNHLQYVLAKCCHSYVRVLVRVGLITLRAATLATQRHACNATPQQATMQVQHNAHGGIHCVTNSKTYSQNHPEHHRTEKSNTKLNY